MPSWDLTYAPAAPVDVGLQAVEQLEAVVLAAVRAVCCLLVASWLTLLLMRLGGWRVLFGRTTPWGLAQWCSGIQQLGLVVDAVEVAAAALVLGICEDQADRGAPGWQVVAAVALPLLAAVVLPSSLLALQLVCPGDALLPKRARLCCCKIRRRAFVRLLVGSLVWHALVALLGTAVSALRLMGRGNSLAGERGAARAAAAAACRAEVKARCVDAERQVPDFARSFKLFCAQDCTQLATPDADVVAELERLLYFFGLCVGAWSLATRVAQLALAWLVKSSPEARKRSKGKAEEGLPVDGQLALENGGGLGEAVLTPDLFRLGVREAAEEGAAREAMEAARRAREEAAQKAAEEEDARRTREELARRIEEEPNTPRSAAVQESMERILAAVTLVEPQRASGTRAVKREVNVKAPKVELIEADGDAAAASQFDGHGQAGAAEGPGGGADGRSAWSARSGGKGDVIKGLSARDQRNMLDFAQTLARTVSKDGSSSEFSRGSEERAARRGEDLQESPGGRKADDNRSEGVVSSRSSGSSSGRKRYVADW